MTQFPQTLKSWRTARRFSQMDLALEAEVSTRHLSFLETGRSQPSREMIARLSDALQLPLDARNQMLTTAGFAPRYPGRTWRSDEMAPIRRSIDMMLTHHLPYPGLAVDRLWRVQQMNPTAATLYGHFGVGVGDSLLDLLLSPHLQAALENWPEVAHHAAARLRTESAAQGGVPEFDRAIRALTDVGGTPDVSPGPVIPTVVRLGEARLSMFATIAQFGTPDDVTLDDLKVELYFPMDETSDGLLRGLASNGDGL